MLFPINAWEVGDLNIADMPRHKSFLQLWSVLTKTFSTYSDELYCTLTQRFSWKLSCLIHHHITCGEPVYPLGNFTILLMIDESDRYLACSGISVGDKSINPELKECGLWFVLHK